MTAQVPSKQQHLFHRPTEVPSIANQLRQRRAVAALRDRMRIKIASQVFRDGALQSARVVIEGEFYDVNERQLTRLRQGATPTEIDLEPADCGEDC